MGLMSFLKSAGQAVGLVSDDPKTPAEMTVAERAERNGKATAKIQHILDVKELGFEGLGVVFQDGNVIMTGTAPSQEAREKAVIAVGNLKGVETVDDQIHVEDPAPAAVFHTVVKGDTLSKIAREYYGVMRMYDHIFVSNQPMLADPDEIFEGQVLRIPPVSARIHEIKKGDTLSGIAKWWYGDYKMYTTIFEANRDVIDNADVVKAGWLVKIPLVNPKVPGCENLA